MSTDKYGGRKFVLTCVIFLTSSFLTYMKILDSADYRSISVLILLTYVVGNVGQKYVLGIKDGGLSITSEATNTTTK